MNRQKYTRVSLRKKLAILCDMNNAYKITKDQQTIWFFNFLWTSLNTSFYVVNALKITKFLINDLNLQVQWTYIKGSMYFMSFSFGRNAFRIFFFNLHPVLAFSKWSSFTVESAVACWINHVHYVTTRQISLYFRFNFWWKFHGFS